MGVEFWIGIEGYKTGHEPCHWCVKDQELEDAEHQVSCTSRVAFDYGPFFHDIILCTNRESAICLLCCSSSVGITADTLTLCDLSSNFSTNTRYLHYLLAQTYTSSGGCHEQQRFTCCIYLIADGRLVSWNMCEPPYWRIPALMLVLIVFLCWIHNINIIELILLRKKPRLKILFNTIKIQRANIMLWVCNML